MVRAVGSSGQLSHGSIKGLRSAAPAAPSAPALQSPPPAEAAAQPSPAWASTLPTVSSSHVLPMALAPTAARSLIRFCLSAASKLVPLIAVLTPAETMSRAGHGEQAPGKFVAIEIARDHLAADGLDTGQLIETLAAIDR